MAQHQFPVPAAHHGGVARVGDLKGINLAVQPNANDVFHRIYIQVAVHHHPVQRFTVPADKTGIHPFRQGDQTFPTQAVGTDAVHIARLLQLVYALLQILPSPFAGVFHFQPGGVVQDSFIGFHHILFAAAVPAKVIEQKGTVPRRDDLVLAQEIEVSQTFAAVMGTARHTAYGGFLQRIVIHPGDQIISVAVIFRFPAAVLAPVITGGVGTVQRPHLPHSPDGGDLGGSSGFRGCRRATAGTGSKPHQQKNRPKLLVRRFHWTTSLV